MMILMSAALVAAQPAPAPAPQGQMAPMQHEQQKQPEPTKTVGCKDCCKDMAKGEHDHGAEHGGHSTQ